MKEITTKKLLETIIEGIRNRKGQRIVTIDLRKIKEAPVEMMIICEGQSNTAVERSLPCQMRLLPGKVLSSVPATKLKTT